MASRSKTQMAIDAGNMVIDGVKTGAKNIASATRAIGAAPATKTLLQGGAGLAAASIAANFASASPQEVLAARGLSSSTRGPGFPTPSKNAMYRLWVVNNYAISGSPTVVKAWIPEQISLDVSATYSALFGGGFFSDDNLFNLGARTTGFTGLTQEMSYKIWTSSQGITMTIPVIFTMDDTQLESEGSLQAGSRGTGFSDYDIIGSILELQKLCLPSKVPESWFLEPPGSVIRGQGLISAVGNTIANATTALAGAVANAALNPIDTLGNAGIAYKDVVTGQGDQKKDMGVQTVQGPKISSGPSEFQAKKLVESYTSVYIGDFLYFDMVVMENVGAAYDMQLNERGKPIRATVNITFSTLFDATIQDLNSIYLVNPQVDPNSKSNPNAKA